MLIISLSFFLSLTLAIIVPITQDERHYVIEPENFKKKKIKNLSFLFRGYCEGFGKHGNVNTYGVIYPMFVFHIVGYIMSLVLFSITLVLVCAFNIDEIIVFIINIATLFSFFIAYIITIRICVSISKKRYKWL